MASSSSTTKQPHTVKPTAMSVAAKEAQATQLAVTGLDPQMTRFFAGGMASATAEIITLPIDCTKVRLQAQRSVPVLSSANGAASAASGAQYNGMVDAVRKIVQEEGAGALWKGASPALMRQVSYTSICMVLYEPLRDIFGANKGTRGEVPFVNKFLAGGCAGAIGITFANPVDVIKVRMQADKTGVLYRSVGDAFSKIYQREGLRGFVRGLPPNIQRGFIVNAAELGTIDVIKTRLMSQPTDAMGRGSLYSGMADCAKKTFEEGGVQAFYKGFIPNWMRKAPWCVIFFVTYEKYRAALSAE
ncbi:hypothetical protein P43SY_003559 [Pythium insidiosum]|uniref:Mitochondrial Carrier (MC) Family n=1 Tax=Pythium insidiosum TaxID=114742 RepID=A0AAD5LVY3_PYTIN|nr:hypothetical protein P43SY_003559 [Pythium insidiosum]